MYTTSPHKQHMFEFNPQTADRLTDEQKPFFFSDFSMTRDDHMIEMVKQFPRAFRRAGSIAVEDLTVVVIKDVAQIIRKHPTVLILPDEKDPRGWGFACRYRSDVPWYVAALPGRFTNPTFRNYPVASLGHFKHLRNCPPLDQFISDGMWGIQQNKQPSWRPMANFLFCLSHYLLGDDLQNLSHALTSVNFFPVETDDSSLDWTLRCLTGGSVSNPNDNDAINEISCQIFKASPTSTHLAWEQIFHQDNEHTQVWVARSKYHPEDCNDPPTTLGVLVGGVNPINEEPQIHHLFVLPDERRRGIATSLVKRFMNQTGYTAVLVETKEGHRPQYEGCGFLAALKATIRHKKPSLSQWDLCRTFMNS